MSSDMLSSIDNYNSLATQTCRNSLDRRYRFVTGVEIRNSNCWRHGKTGVWMEVHRPVKRVDDRWMMTRMLARTQLLFSSGRCRTRFSRPMRLPREHCLVVSSYEPWEIFAKSARGWWRMVGESFVGWLPSPGDLVQWPRARRAHALQAPSQWHLPLPSNKSRGSRIVFHLAALPERVARARRAERAEQKSTQEIALESVKKQWLRRGPTVFNCNASGFHPEWSELRQRLWLWAKGVDLELLPSVPEDVLASSLAAMQKPQEKGSSDLTAAILSGEASEADWLHNLAVQEKNVCMLGLINALFVVGVHKLKIGLDATRIMLALYNFAFQPANQAYWVLLDGRVWPVTAAAVMNYLDVFAEETQVHWRRCPCPPGKPKFWPPPPTRSSRRIGVAILGNHNYIADVALGFQDASAEVGFFVDIAILGYALAQKYDSAREYCRLLRSGTCVPNFRVEYVLHQLTKVNPREGSVITPNLKRRGETARSIDELNSLEGITLGQMRTMLERTVHATPEIEQADLLVCTYPYIYALLLDEVPATRSKAFLLPLQGGVPAEYTEEDLQAWLHGRLTRWTQELNKTSDQGPRWVVAMNGIQHAWYGRAIGPMPFLPLAGRHVLGVAAKTGSHIHRHGRILLHRFEFILAPQEYQLVKFVLEDALRNANYPRQYFLYSQKEFRIFELFNFKAVAMIPWNFCITTFIEIYRLAVPIFVPDAKWMHALVWRYFYRTELQQINRFTELRHEWQSSANCHFHPLPRDCPDPENNLVRRPPLLRTGERVPWLQAGIPDLPLSQQIRRWWIYTDYMKMPHLMYFTGIVDLMEQALHFTYEDATDIVKKMQKVNQEALRTSTDYYKAMLSAL
ncbi:unnamed protein product [Symbiodinium sp. CCMP2592]|nr:unnamed protein product [Symbiodinium sp. CCMP2592]